MTSRPTPAARGESTAAFDGRCILALGVARRLNIPDVGASSTSPSPAAARTFLTDVIKGNFQMCTLQSACGTRPTS
jgi:hypothetical protein